ncbi:hypothetical protein EON65_40795, partial [archaeon]
MSICMYMCMLHTHLFFFHTHTTPPPYTPTITSVDTHDPKLSADAIKSLITSEVRTQLMSPAIRYTTKDMSNYRSMAAAPAYFGDRKRAIEKVK